MKLIKTIYHPKTKEIKEEIHETDCGRYCFDMLGDWYDEEMGGIEECIKDANRKMNEIYNGTYYEETSMERSEKMYRGYF